MTNIQSLTSNLNSLGEFKWDELSDKEFLIATMQFTRTSNKAGDGISGRVFKMGLDFVLDWTAKHGDVIAQPKQIATGFKLHVQRLVNSIRDEDKDFDPTVFGFKEGKTDITGNGPFAASFKKVFNALWYGGDLRTLGTVSQCGTYAAKEAQKEQDKDRAIQVRKEVGLEVEVLHKLSPGTPEYEAMVDKIMAEKLKKVEGTGTSTNGDTKAKDELDIIAEIFLKELRDFHQINPTQAIQMAETQIRAMADARKALLANMARQLEESQQKAG